MTNSEYRNITEREKTILEKAKTLLLDSDCNTTVLAKKIGSNRNTISKIFLKATGGGPKKWVREHRLDTARSLIHEGKTDITEISYRSGYKYPSTFSTVYKKHFGVSPRKDRKLNRFAKKNAP